MPSKTKKDKGNKGDGLQIRTIKSKKERQQGGFFFRLKTDEWIKGHAIFTPDPEAAGNPGYIEYMEHYDKPNGLYVPCAGDDCYMCKRGDNPQGRALTLWYFPENPEKERLKVLKLNGFMIRDFAEIDEEEGGVLGRYFRVKRLSDDGKYRVSVSTDKKKLKKDEIKAILKALKDGPIGDFEEMLMRQLRAALAKIEGLDEMTDTDDDDEDEDEKPKAKKGKPAEDDDEDEDEEDEDEDENEDDDESDSDEDEDDDEDESEEDDDEEDESDEDDEDEDEDESDDEDEDEKDDDDDEDEDEDEEDDEDDEDEDTSFEHKGLEVVSTKEDDEIVTVKLEGKNTKLWIGKGLEIDYGKVVKGTTIHVKGELDNEGDHVLNFLKITKAAPKSGGKDAKKDDKKKPGGKKGGKKK